MVEHTSELNAIISGLHASTTYEIQVRERVEIQDRTCSYEAHIISMVS